jgi:phosphoenolpyruvate carboxykinase (ATP)
VDTGKHTGRSAKDKFFVREPSPEDRIAWGEVNQPISGSTSTVSAKRSSSI